MTTPITSKLYDIIQGLYVATKARKLDWELTDKPEIFLAYLGNIRCLIRSRPDPDYPEQPDFFVDLYDERGVCVETISNETMPERPPDRESDAPHAYTMLKETHELAR